MGRNEHSHHPMKNLRLDVVLTKLSNNFAIPLSAIILKTASCSSDLMRLGRLTSNLNSVYNLKFQS